jgi:hypothetical protein
MESITLTHLEGGKPRVQDPSLGLDLIDTRGSINANLMEKIMKNIDLFPSHLHLKRV